MSILKNKVTINVLNYRIYIARNMKELSGVLKRTKNFEKDYVINHIKEGGFTGVCFTNQMESIIYSEELTLNVLVHELLHAIQHAGSYYNVRDNEFDAYTLGYLVDQFKHLVNA